MTKPKTYFAAMVSSTFNDLKDHRGEVIDALHHNDLLPKVMEYDTARADADVIDSSLQFVRESHAYICVIGPRYGQTPHDEARNPDRLSITELEFDEAQRLGRPILLFIASENHKWTRADFEFDAEKQKKLEAFCARAKLMKTDGEVHRVYAEFRSSEELGRQAEQAIANMAAQLDANPAPDAPAQTTEAEIVEDVLSLKPPLLRALPSYAASHSFIRRKVELNALDECAQPDAKDPVLLFEAMGGSGKSMLIWEWATDHATKAHPGLKGRFWYSF